MMDKIPNDPWICLSFINTQLRDFDADLDELCGRFHIERQMLEKKLGAIGYLYREEQNQFC